jgi:SAM-dependent methyltransferase
VTFLGFKTNIWYEAKNLPKSAKDARENTADGDEVFDYVAKNKSILQAADATKLPYLTASIDMVLSHQLINSLTDEKCFLAIQEMARVIKKGGQARIAFHDQGARFDQMLDRLEAVPWLKIQKIQTGTRNTRYGKMAEFLFIIEKTDAAP